MIFAHIADLHITEKRGDSQESLEDQEKRLVWIGADAGSNAVEAMLVAGDVFDTESSPAERNTAVRVFSAWADTMPVVVVYGNHDRPGDLDFLSHLRAKNPIHVVSGHQSIPLGDMQIEAIAWPRKSWVAATVEPGADVTASAVAAMRALLRGVSVGWQGNATRVILAHLQLGGAVSDSGQPLIGTPDVEVSESDLVDTGADVVLLGHIHKHQVHGGAVVYAGSTRQCNFGESPQKGYCLIMCSRGKGPRIEHRQAPGRLLLTTECDWPIGDVPDVVPKSSIVRLTYHATEDSRREAAAWADEVKESWIAAGAYSVKIDPHIEAVEHVRAREIRDAKTNPDRLKAWWKTRGEDPVRSDSILAKLAELTSSVA